MRKIIGFRSGGTVGMSAANSGELKVDAVAQDSIFGIINSIPGIEYEVNSLGDCDGIAVGGDSSDYPRKDLLQIAGRVLEAASTSQPVILEHGTDTMDLVAATVAISGNELIRAPVVVLGSMKCLSEPNSDAPENAKTAAVFAAFSDTSGVFTVRPGGHVFTSRSDTYGLEPEWHARGYVPPTTSYLGRVDLQGLEAVIKSYVPKGRAKPNTRDQLHPLITLAEMYRDDGTLDYFDQIVVSKQGLFPFIQLAGEGGLQKGTEHFNLVYFIMKSFKHAGATMPYLVSTFAKSLDAEINLRIKEGKLVSKTIPTLVACENVRRYRMGKRKIYEHWETIFTDAMTPIIGKEQACVARDFWKDNSRIANLDMSFDGLLVIDAATDPKFLANAFSDSNQLPHGVIIKGTGSAGLRLKDKADSYEPFLRLLKEKDVPVVLTSSSSGEVTSFKYGPARKLIEEDLVYFAGTMDADLMLPRLALLNHDINSTLLHRLISASVSSKDDKTTLTRNIHRQLLSGNHYAKPLEGQQSDRKRIEQLYGIESRADLLGGMHVKKAILSAYLNETVRQDLPIPTAQSLERVLRG